MSEPAELWLFLPIGYLLSVLFEMPVLLLGLSAQHSLRRKIFAGFWLTACTYPIVILVLPLLLEERFGQVVYLVVAETIAPLAECLLFSLAFYPRQNDDDISVAGANGALRRDMLTIVAANFVSFLIGGAALRLVWPQES